MSTSREYWTKADEDRLITMAAQGKTDRQIADALRRTTRAVSHKRVLLGIKKTGQTEQTDPDKSGDSGLIDGTKGAESGAKDAESGAKGAEESRATEREAEEPEDDTGDGSTELEREFRFQASVIDTLSNELKAYRGQVEGNLTTVLERTNELSKDATLMRDAAHGLTKVVNTFMDRLYIVELWLSQSCFYRLTHSFRKFAEAHHDN